MIQREVYHYQAYTWARDTYFGLTEYTADSETEVRYIQNGEHNWICDLLTLPSTRGREAHLRPTEDCRPHGEGRRICDLWKTAVHTEKGSAELSGTEGTQHSSSGTERKWQAPRSKGQVTSTQDFQATITKMFPKQGQHLKRKTGGYLHENTCGVIYWRMGHLTVKKNDSPSSSSH